MTRGAVAALRKDGRSCSTAQREEKRITHTRCSGGNLLLFLQGQVRTGADMGKTAPGAHTGALFSRLFLNHRGHPNKKKEKSIFT